MSILSFVLLLHIYVVVNLNNYYFSSGIVDDSRTIVQAQSPATSLKIIDQLNSIFCYPAANENVLSKHNRSFCGNRTMNTGINPIKTESYSIKLNPILTLLITTRGTDVKYVL